MWDINFKAFSNNATNINVMFVVVEEKKQKGKKKKFPFMFWPSWSSCFLLLFRKLATEKPKKQEKRKTEKRVSRP